MLIILLIKLDLIKKMTTFPINIYNPICSLPERHQQFYLTTCKIIVASYPIFGAFLPDYAITGLHVIKKSVDLKTKVCKFSRQYFSSNKKNIQKRRSKISNKRKTSSYQKKKRRSKNLVKNNFYIWPHLRDISLSGIGIHTLLYKTFPGRMIVNLEKTVKNLNKISSIYSTGKHEIITKEMLLLTKNIFHLVAILSGYNQIMLPVYLLGVLAALLNAYIETNNEEYLAAYTQVLWSVIYLLLLNRSYEQSFKETLNNRKII